MNSQDTGKAELETKNSSLTNITSWSGMFPPTALGLCFLLTLQGQLIGFLFPASASVIVSPVAVGTASAALLIVLCYVSYRSDTAVLPTSSAIVLSLVTTAGAVASGVVIATVNEPNATEYAAAVIVGVSLAGLAYLWASVYVRLPARNALLAAVVSLLLSGVLDFAGIQAATFVDAWPLVLAFGAGTCLCFIVAARRIAASEEGQITARPVIYLPVKMKQYAQLVCGIALYALALGVVAGTTAANSTGGNMGSLNASVNRLHLVASIIIVLVTLALGKRVNLALLIRIFTPLLVVVFLLNIAVPQFSGELLACTFFAWTLLQLFAFLLAVHIARQRIASLSLAFPIVWALVFVGHALGIFAGQLYVATTGNEQQMVFVMAVVLSVIVVAASSLLLSNAGALLAPGRQTDQAEQGASEAENTPAAEPATATTETPETPLEAACRVLAESHHLSERETEVFGLLARGYTRTSIAKKLFVSENTVRVHVKNVYAKLYVHSKQQLIDLVEAKAHR